MNDRDSDRAEAIRQIAAVLAAAYVRLRFPEESGSGLHASIEYTRSPFSPFTERAVSPCFFVSDPPALRRARVVCDCQLISVMISFRVTPPGRFSSSITRLC